MFSKVRITLAGAAVASALVLTACGGGGGGGAKAVNTTDGIGFVETTLSLPANAAATVTYNNKSAGLQHNLVFVKGGPDVAQQVYDAGQADAADYVLDGDPNVIAAGKLLNGGESEPVALPALPAGTYTYICTFPGHFPTMQGTLTVQ